MPQANATDLPRAGVPAHSVWRLRLLGGFELDDGRQQLTRLPSRTGSVLLACLALAPGRAHAREELCELLWPGAPGPAGRARLRQTLSQLRAVLEPPGGAPVLLADRRVLRLAPGALWCDVTAFEQAARRDDHDEARALYRGELLPGLDSEWVLEERERLQALAADLSEAPVAAAVSPHAPAPIRPAGAASRLPSYLTRLVGAEVQAARLQAALQLHRIVTVVGAGGCGKTRLAVEVARASAGATTAAFARTVFVDLPDCGTRGGLLECLAGTLDDGPVLLLLDHCDRLDAAALTELALLASQRPQARWLLTACRPLALADEHVFTLPPLELPAPDAGLEELAANAAVTLFVDRARAHRPDFQVTADNGASLVALLRHLEGMPRAIERAAAHSRTLGPADLFALLAEAPDPGDTAAA